MDQGLSKEQLRMKRIKTHVKSLGGEEQGKEEDEEDVPPKFRPRLVMKIFME